MRLISAEIHAKTFRWLPNKQMNKKHSTLGIISIILALSPIISFFEITNIKLYSPFFYIFLVIIPVTAPTLGIVGLLQKDKKKTFAIIGTILSLISIFPVIFLILFLLKPDNFS